MISIGRGECTLSNNICYTCEFSLVIERCSLVVVSLYSAGRSAALYTADFLAHFRRIFRLTDVDEKLPCYVISNTFECLTKLIALF
jgi:hypothetical protein